MYCFSSSSYLNLFCFCRFAVYDDLSSATPFTDARTYNETYGSGQLSDCYEYLESVGRSTKADEEGAVEESRDNQMGYSSISPLCFLSASVDRR